VPLHPVEEVFVHPGDRVKKGQKLVKIDDEEQQAEIRSKTANLESAQVSLKEARRLAKAVEETHHEGGIPATTYFATRAALLKAEQDERAAKGALDSAKAELEHYTVVAMADGVVSWLDVCPGMVSRPGTSTWGEILDLTEIDVRCELTPEDADRIAAGQRAEVCARWSKTVVAGKVVLVGIAADKITCRVPVVVRLPNTGASLRCGVSVQVSFTEARLSGRERRLGAGAHLGDSTEGE
jgi:membrane fusion protein (multidrug efflux system)